MREVSEAGEPLGGYPGCMWEVWKMAALGFPSVAWKGTRGVGRGWVIGTGIYAVIVTSNSINLVFKTELRDTQQTYALPTQPRRDMGTIWEYSPTQKPMHFALESRGTRPTHRSQVSMNCVPEEVYADTHVHA